jgi:hypothetical protein
MDDKVVNWKGLEALGIPYSERTSGGWWLLVIFLKLLNLAPKLSSGLVALEGNELAS